MIGCLERDDCVKGTVMRSDVIKRDDAVGMICERKEEKGVRGERAF